MSSLGVNIVIFQNDTVLLTKREDFEVWCLPGGHVDPGESMAQAAIRETYEETGLQVKLTRLVGVYSRPLWYDGTYHICLFAAEVVGGELRLQAEEVLEARYFPITMLPDEILIGTQHRILDAANGIGGSIAVCEDYPWPSETGRTRSDIYALRDQSNLPRSEAYAHFTRQINANDFRIEAGASQSSPDTDDKY